MENGRVTIYDVAERAGVSIATVSRAMSGGSISAKSRQKVQEAIEALHYQPSTTHSHPQAQEKRTGTLALVIGDFDNPYCSMLMRGAELEATRHGYALEVFCHTPGKAACSCARISAFRSCRPFVCAPSRFQRRKSVRMPDFFAAWAKSVQPVR